VHKGTRSTHAFDAPEHGGTDGLGLLEDFLLHEVFKATLKDALQLALESLDDPRHGHGAVLSLHVENSPAGALDMQHVSVFKSDRLLNRPCGYAFSTRPRVASC
jgi:hypothetical protein